jgi:FkbM family methyltransferase
MLRSLRRQIELAATALRAHPGTLAAWNAYRTLSRLERAARTAVPASGTEIAVDMDGLDVRGFGYPQLLHLYKEIFLEQDYAIDLGTDHPTIVDCGSNIGISIAYFKRAYPNARVVGFEPHPRLFQVLRGNLDRNGMIDVQANNCALGKATGSVPFFVSDNPGLLRSSVRPDRGGDFRIDVRMERLSDHLRALDTIDLVKIDVEGAERAVLEDLLETGMLGRPRSYVIEYHLNIGSDRSDLSSVLRIFEDNGFNYNLQAERKRRRRFQDVLIYCSRAGS